MIEPLNPQHLTPSASLNRLRIATLLDGVRFGEAAIGKTGNELASTAYLAAQVRANASLLDLSSEMLQGEDRDLPRLLSAVFNASETPVRSAAHSIIHQFGRNIGCILLTLKQGDPANRAARADWDESYWSHWRSIQTVFCAGGLMNAAWWDEVHSGIGEVFAQAGIDGLDVQRASFGDSLALVGAARRIPADTGRALVFDFGGSFVKCASARYADGALVELRRLPTTATRCMSEGQITELFNFMAALIAQSYRDEIAGGGSLSPSIPVSLAAYVDSNGQPYERQGGIYAALRNLSPNVQVYLSEAVSSRVDSPLKVLLLHDGSAAACAYAGVSDAATIMFGTALGIGFPPPAAALTPISSQFVITK